MKKKIRWGYYFSLREMTFPTTQPTLLNLAAILEAHSLLFPEYRLFTTMCYWYAGSVYKVLQALFEGVSKDLEHGHKAGKLGIFTGYSTAYDMVRDAQKAGRMEDLVDAVRAMKQQNASRAEGKRALTPDEIQEMVAELQKMPTFERLCAYVRERREEVVAMLSERLRKETALEAANERAIAAEEELARVKRAAEKEIARLREQLAAASVAVAGAGK